MLRPKILLIASLLAPCAWAQAPQPQMRINMVNVCTPGDADREEISAALTRIPARPVFNADYEVARGHTTDKTGASQWIRIRHEFVSDPMFTNVQYQFVVGTDGIQEMLVFYTRESKPGQPMQISLAQKVTAGTAAQVLAANTPPERITIGRFGKASLVLARCPNSDQKAYESLFHLASDRFAVYRSALQVRTSVPGELARMRTGKPAVAKKPR